MVNPNIRELAELQAKLIERAKSAVDGACWESAGDVRQKLIGDIKAVGETMILIIPGTVSGFSTNGKA